MTGGSLPRLSAIAAVISMLLAACTHTNPGTAAGRSDIAGQQCTLCIAENPGDYDACHAICVQRVEDEAAYLRALGR
jgi:type IV pilus biogenesis protein CpaD/CtpE